MLARSLAADLASAVAPVVAPVAAPVAAGPAEPRATALLLAVVGVLLAASALSSRATQRVSVPVALLFLGLGVLAGSEGIGHIPFDDHRLAFRLGTIALVLILFDGGLATPRASVRAALRPAGVLATAGVLGTAAAVGAAAHALGVPWAPALLLGAVVSSTDAAAVFAVLRGSGLSLKRRVGTTLEVESGLNDPMAVILTTAMTAHLLAVGPAGAGALPGWGLAAAVAREVVVEMTVGLAVGWAVGRGGRALLLRARLPAGGLYPVLTLALAALAYAVPTLLHGSGFLAVYVAGVLIGDGPLPYRPGLVRVHDALAWLAQVTMFLVLGLLAYPSRILETAATGIALGLVLSCVARPLVVAACLAPFGYTRADVAYVGWVGLRGAVPIVLAIIPVLAGAPEARRVLDIVFVMVVVNAIVPGATVPWVTRRLGLVSAEPPAPRAVLEIESMQPLEGELLSFHVDPALAVTGVALADLPFPEGAAATLIVRGRQLVAPRGHTRLEAGDHVYVFARPEDLGFIQLMFGRPDDE